MDPTLMLVLGVVALGLVVYGYLPYLIDVLRGRTRPHSYSWLLWALVTVIAAGVQLSHGGGLGAWVTAATGLACTSILLGSLRHGERLITTLDRVCLGLGLVSIAAWLVADQPLVSILLATAIDLIGFVPTVRKSWPRPHEETLLTWVISFVRFGLSAVVLDVHLLDHVLPDRVVAGLRRSGGDAGGSPDTARVSAATAID